MILLLLISLLAVAQTNAAESNNVRYMDLDDNQHYTMDQRVGFRADELQIFCYRGDERRVTHTFRTIQMRLKIKNDEFVQYEGNSPADVRQHYDDKRSLFSWANLLGGTKKREVRLSPFNQTCLGVETAQAYRIHLHLVRFDLVKFGMFCAGIWLFVTARRLTKMPFFYYSSGVGLGVSFSVFLVVWFISRQLPKKSLVFSSLIGGWAVLWYFLQMAWDNARSLVAQYQIYVFYYVCGMGLISFIACYRIGPPTNQRSIDIVKWSLQLFGVVLVYMSSDYPEVPVAIIIGMLAVYYFPTHWFGWVRAAWRRRFPAKIRLLTVAEFEEQAREHTRQELAKMMKYCGSPEAKPWRTVAVLKDPKRFAEFIEHGVHVTEEEVFDHEQSLMEESAAFEDTSDSDSSASGMPAQQSRTPTPVVRGNISETESRARSFRGNSVPNNSPIRPSSRVADRPSAPEISDDEDIPSYNPHLASIPPFNPHPTYNPQPASIRPSAAVTSFGWRPSFAGPSTQPSASRPPSGQFNGKLKFKMTIRPSGVSRTPSAPEISSDDD